MEEKLYYESQAGWNSEDFYALNRFLNRLLLYSSQNIQEIKSIDLSRLSEITKVLLCIIIKFQKKEDLFELDSLKGLKDIKPLEKRLNLVDNPSNCHKIYDEYNVGL